MKIFNVNFQGEKTAFIASVKTHATDLSTSQL